jgi:hypothetical protein
MTAANITTPRPGSPHSLATDGGAETGAAAGEASVGETDTNPGSLVRIALRVVPIERWAARRGRTAPLSSVGQGARR